MYFTELAERVEYGNYDNGIASRETEVFVASVMHVRNALIILGTKHGSRHLAFNMATMGDLASMPLAQGPGSPIVY